MQIQVKSAKHETYKNLGRYFYASMEAGKHSLTVAIAPEHVQVIVENAANRAWRGMGKRFENMAAALGNYKTPEIRAMLQAAEELSKGGDATTDKLLPC